MKLATALLLCLGMTVPVRSYSQGLDPAEILKASPQSWPTYSGDYTGQRYSPLKQIDTKNVRHLSLAWSTQVTAGTVRNASLFGFNGATVPIVGGEGSDVKTPATIRGAILQVDGILYPTAPDNIWALDARDGHELWHFYWKTRGGTHIGNRGAAVWHDNVYMETPDDFLICLDRKTGKEKWHKEIANFDLQYFSTMAPIVIGNHLLIGTGDDLDQPGYLESLDPDTGNSQWRHYSVPTKEGDPGLETWASLDAASHGGGNVWIPGSYDPETHNYIYGTGNPTAAYTSQKRGPGDNLYTCALIAVNVDTGKMSWYFQTSPHDTHDFDSAQTPVLVDGDFGGKPRKMVITLARNGFFFVLDRVSGEHLLTKKITDVVNWDKGIDPRGEPVREPAKDFDIGGALVSPGNAGVVNWPPPAFNRNTGLFYAPTGESISMYYLTTTDKRGAMGLGGKDEFTLGSRGSYITAIDYRTGKVAWNHRFPGVDDYSLQPGLLTTAGNLVFGGNPGGSLVAYDAANGTPLWHSKIGVTNAPETYELDGQQYILVGAGDSVYAFLMND